ncbi:MAG: hypothetical protein ACYC4U_11320 [Pirellulaceae bacterium]
MARLLLCLGVLLLLGTTAWGQITVPAETAVGEKIVATIKLAGVPEGAELKGVGLFARGYQWEYGATQDVLHIWGKPGTYTLDVVVQWGVRDKEKPTAWSDFGMMTYQADFKITGGVTPPPPPPLVNPYKPAPAFQAAAKPVQALSLNKTDSRALSEVYSLVAQQVRAGKYKTLGEVRRDLVELGNQLKLKGKYVGLASAVDAYLSTTLGLEEVVPAVSAGDALETLAWAVFETGRAG